MPAPLEFTYSVASKVAAHTAFRDLLDFNINPAQIKLRSAADVLLATITLADPAGSINGGTGQLTLNVALQETAAPNGGIVAYGEVCDGAGVVHLSLPAKEGAAADPGWIVMNILNVIAGGPVNIVDARVG